MNTHNHTEKCQLYIDNDYRHREIILCDCSCHSPSGTSANPGGQGEKEPALCPTKSSNPLPHIPRCEARAELDPYNHCNQQDIDGDCDCWCHE